MFERHVTPLPDTRLMRKLITVLTAALLAGGCRNMRADANVAEAMIQIGNQISGMQQDYSALQFTVDSLRQVVARQDTLISHLASLTGMPLTR
jgi:hypothetical protein